MIWQLSPSPAPSPFPATGVETSNAWWSQMITLILGGAGVTLLTTLVWAINTLRAGARARSREILHDLEAARDAAEDRARITTADAVYWQGIAGRYGYQLRALCGREPEPANPQPPSMSGALAGHHRQIRLRRDKRGGLWIEDEGGAAGPPRST